MRLHLETEAFPTEIHVGFPIRSMLGALVAVIGDAERLHLALEGSDDDANEKTVGGEADVFDPRSFAKD